MIGGNQALRDHKVQLVKEDHQDCRDPLDHRGQVEFPCRDHREHQERKERKETLVCPELRVYQGPTEDPAEMDHQVRGVCQVKMDHRGRWAQQDRLAVQEPRELQDPVDLLDHREIRDFQAPPAPRVSEESGGICSHRRWSDL